MFVHLGVDLRRSLRVDTTEVLRQRYDECALSRGVNSVIVATALLYVNEWKFGANQDQCGPANRG